MIVEDALLRLGDRPLKRSPFSHVIVGMANSYLENHQIDNIDAEMSADQVYARIWKLPKDQRQELLDNKVGVMRDRDTYRITLTALSALMALIIVPVAVIEIMSVGSENSGVGFKFLGELFGLFFGLLQTITP